jgi:colicin import membrane protein
MAKAPRKLKVFRTQIGFHELAVATGSRAAALRAFGARQDLFALGLAAETDDSDVVAVTTAQPDVVLKRPVGSDLPFGTEAARPRIADVDPGGVDPPAEERREKKAETAPPPKKEKPKPDRSKLKAAEERLATLEGEQRQAIAEAEEALDRLKAEERRLRGEIAAAESDGRTLQKEWRERLERAGDAIERERVAFRRAGGDD